MLKAYKFRMYPNQAQETLINKHIGCCRYIYNYSLDKKIKNYKIDKTSISQFEPSTKICNICGTTNYELKLNIRNWTCQNCNAQHDRDINAAINIKKFALQNQNLIGIAPKGLRVEPLEISALAESMN